MDIPEMAGKAEKIVEEIARVEPMLAGITKLFVPGAAPIVTAVQPMIALALPFIERALENIAAEKNGDALAAFAELISHLSKGLPNSPALSPVGITAPIGATIPAVGAEGG